MEEQAGIQAGIWLLGLRSMMEANARAKAKFSIVMQESLCFDPELKPTLSSSAIAHPAFPTRGAEDP